MRPELLRWGSQTALDAQPWLVLETTCVREFPMDAGRKNRMTVPVGGVAPHTWVSIRSGEKVHVGSGW